MGLFSWLFKNEGEASIPDRYASPLSHDWRDLGPVRGHIDQGLHHDDHTLQGPALSMSAGATAGAAMGHTVVEEHWTGPAGRRINPANGLPMLNDAVDIHGNPFGTSGDTHTDMDSFNMGAGLGAGIDDSFGMGAGMDSFGMGGFDDRW